MERIGRKIQFCGKIKYRHVICVGITLWCIGFTVVRFPYAFARLIRAFQDFGVSVAYFFTKPYGIEVITPTVTTLPEIGSGGGAGPLPYEWDSFKIKLIAFWKMFINGDVFSGFWKNAVMILPLLTPLLTLMIAFAGILIAAYKRSVSGKNNDYAKESKALKCWKRFSGTVLTPIKDWFVAGKYFLEENSFWVKIWLGIWLLNFNLISVAVDFFAWYFYFAASFDIAHIWFQVYKMGLDLWGMIKFIPPAVWVVLVLWRWNKKRFETGTRRLRMMEIDNRDFIRSQPIQTESCAEPGAGKTTFITSASLSTEAMFRDKAFEIILNNDLKFPDFPWINFENDLRLAMENHFVYNLYTAREWVTAAARSFVNFPSVFTCFGYDYKRYPLQYNDGLNVQNLFEVLDSYARAFVIYLVESSLIVSNFSVRSDNILLDEGNLPLWDTDFLNRDARLRDIYSRYAHILDFEFIRLGKRLTDNVGFTNALEFGIIDITEVGKERGNTMENKRYEKEKYKDTANPTTDLLNAFIKLCRHLSTIDGFPFVRFYCDEQRPETWGADARDLCKIVRIEEMEKSRLAVPMFYLEESFCDWALEKFKFMYADYRYRRGDDCLPEYFLHLLVSKVKWFKDYMYGKYGFRRQRVTVEKGSLDGEKLERVYYIVHKKDYAERFSSDCYVAYFGRRTALAEIGMDEMPEYESVCATMDEMAMQNSYFIRDLMENLCKRKMAA
ncbi:MAG: hypothetical protein KH054_10855 [Firmicutes bacterium]|nr:hypothetical protein [Bacillota bacterium]